MSRPAREERRRGLLAVLLLALLASSGTASAADADKDSEALLPAWFPGLASALKDAPPFFRDTRLLLHFRTYYRNNEASPDTFQEAWAAGGWIAYRSGWLADVFSIGATGYFSLPIYAPADKGGTLLLEPGQDPIAALGEAWAKLRYADQVLTGYRQLINVGYVNPQDNRMVPNTSTTRGFHGARRTPARTRPASESVAPARSAMKGLGVPGLTAYVWYAQGSGLISPANGTAAPSEREYNFDITYTFQSGWSKGLQIKTRAALIDLEGTPGLLPDIRLILNWPIPLL